MFIGLLFASFLSRYRYENLSSNCEKLLKLFFVLIFIFSSLAGGELIRIIFGSTFKLAADLAANWGLIRS